MPGRWFIVLLVPVVMGLPTLRGATPSAGDSLASDSALVLTDARVVDPDARTIRRGTLVIRGDTIARVGGGVPDDGTGRVVDLAGQWVIPGLHDLHVHAYGNMGTNPRATRYFGPVGTARRALRAGVTGLLDLGNAEAPILRARSTTRADSTAASLFAAGPVFTCPNGHGTEYGVPGMARTVTSPSEARDQVDALAVKSPDVVKIIYTPESQRLPSIGRATMHAIVDAAASHGLKTVVHIGSWTGAEHAVAAGATALTHTPAGPVPDTLIEALHTHGTIWIPTLAVHTSLRHWADRPAGLDDPLHQNLVSDRVLASYRDTTRYSDRMRRFSRRLQSERPRVMKAAQTLLDAGISVLAGTDAGNPGVFQGVSLHRELKLLVAAGLSPWDALAAATTRAGAFLDANTGVRVGDRADLVVLGASPVEDIRNTRAIRHVVHDGRLVDRSPIP